MKVFIILVLVLVSGCEMTPERRQFYQQLQSALSNMPDSSPANDHHAKPAHTRHGILKRSTVTGATRQCVYSVAGETHVLTIQNYEICPINHNF